MIEPDGLFRELRNIWSGKLTPVAVPALFSSSAQALSAHECRELSGTATLYLDLEPAGCKTPSTLKTVQLKALSEAVGEVDKIKLSPAEGTAVATITLEACAAEGKYKLTGTATGLVQAASPPSGEFSATSSSLKLGTNAATLTGLFHWATISDSKTIAFERP